MIINYRVFHAVNDYRKRNIIVIKSQLSCAHLNRKRRSYIEEFNCHIKLVHIKVKLLTSMNTMIVMIMINSVHNNDVPESHYHPSLNTW